MFVCTERRTLEFKHGYHCINQTTNNPYQPELHYQSGVSDSQWGLFLCFLFGVYHDSCEAVKQRR